MQSAAPEAVDFADETPETLALYGVGDKQTDEFARRCLLARRLVERGVRFVQLYSGDTVGWDAHENVASNHGMYCGRTDKPVTGLLVDLRRRGLLDDTLVIWGGEFGRMPMSEQGKGRDHNPWGYSVWLAGAACAAGSPTARPTRSDCEPSKTRSTSTTCTPRSCTCWASTTRR